MRAWVSCQPRSLYVVGLDDGGVVGDLAGPDGQGSMKGAPGLGASGRYSSCVPCTPRSTWRVPNSSVCTCLPATMRGAGHRRRPVLGYRSSGLGSPPAGLAGDEARVAGVLAVGSDSRAVGQGLQVARR